jgi:hypothetical protein
MMRRVRRFLSWSPAEWRLFLKAWAVLMRVRLQLTAQSMKRVQASLPPAKTPLDETVSIDAIVLAIQKASVLVPRSTCLVRALAGQILLREFGRNSILHLGVNRDQSGKFMAHAWLEHDGQIIIGGAEAGNYVPLTSFSAGRGNQADLNG